MKEKSSETSQRHKPTPRTQSPTMDPMSIDDLVLPTSLASPIGISPSPPFDDVGELPALSTPAITIKTRKDAQLDHQAAFPPSAPPQETLRNHEFDYVQRRVRKTSIDETKVCDPAPVLNFTC